MDEMKTEQIASLVKEGYTSGYYPTWNITIEDDGENEDVRLEYIAGLIKEGYTSGYDPTWQLEVENE